MAILKVSPWYTYVCFEDGVMLNVEKKLTVPSAPSIVPAHSNKLDSDLGNADYKIGVSRIELDVKHGHIQYPAEKSSRRKPVSD